MTKPAKDTKSKSEDTGSQVLLNVRVLKLEDQLEKILNIISNKERNTVFQIDCGFSNSGYLKGSQNSA